MLFIIAADLLHDDDCGIVLLSQETVQSSVFTPQSMVSIFTRQRRCKNSYRYSDSDSAITNRPL